MIAFAHLRGWAVGSFRCVRVQRKDGSVFFETPVGADGKGWPDLVLVRDNILFRELKSEKGRLDPDQQLWRDRLIAAGMDWGVWKPSSWAKIEKELA